MSKIRFISTDNKFSVEISSKTLNFVKHECLKAKNNETGGIIIGKYSRDRYDAIIKTVTGPPKDSIQTKNSFERGVNGLIKLLEHNWKFGHYYLGEWHYHPNSSAQPSGVDNFQMERFSNDNSLKCPEPILLILGGNPNNNCELSVHIYTKNSRLRLIKDNTRFIIRSSLRNNGQRSKS